jgi:plasmid stability protein
MTDLIIENIDPELGRRLAASAQKHSLSLSDEAKVLLSKALAADMSGRKLGSEMFDSIRPEDRGDDLVFEYRGDFPPPKFE